MFTSKLQRFLNENRIVIKFERAINDLRKGLPIAYNSNLLVFASETIDANTLAFLDDFNKTIIIDANRAKRIGLHSTRAVGIQLDILNEKFINQLLTSLTINTENLNTYSDQKFDKILQIMRIAKLIPSALTFNVNEIPENIININESDFEAYEILKNNSLTEVCSAPLNLEDAQEATMKAFRPSAGGKEHYAIIIGDISKETAPLTRVHSSCYTGDLMGSLSCDCGEQLRDSIKLMSNSKNKCGIIVYLMQEGRGIGLTNKLRTYSIQSQGLDTVEANKALGFKEDERSFDVAAQILNSLSINRVKLLTNNPKKVHLLTENDILVDEVVPLITKNASKSDYFKTKIEKLGHLN